MRLLFLAAGLAAVAAAAAAQTKNFSPPSGVPNYFSNEAGAPLGSGGIVHPHMPRSAVVEEQDQPPARSRVAAAAHHRPVRHASAKRKRHETKFASSRSRHQAARHAEGKSRKTKTAAAKSRSERRASAHGMQQSQAIKAAAQGRSAPAKPRQPARPSG